MNLTRVFAGQDVRIDGRDVDVSALAYDSRRVVPSSLFAAIPGAKSDGHDFIAKALAQGATAILCEREVDTGSATRIIAKNARRALALAAKAFYGAPTEQLAMVGVTGTNGKTTTSYLIAAVLEAAGMPTGVIGTLGVKLGDTTIDTGMTTPESLELQQAFASMRDKGAKAVSMEVSSHALAQGRVEGVHYDVGVFTNLTHDHLDFHGTIEAYFEAKAALFRAHLKADGRAVINVDDPYGAELAEELRKAGRTVITVSAFGREADLSASDIKLALTGTRFTIMRDGKPVHIDSPLVGRFNVENLLVTLGVARALDIPDATTLHAIATRGVVPGRLERVRYVPRERAADPAREPVQAATTQHAESVGFEPSGSPSLFAANSKAPPPQAERGAEEVRAGSGEGPVVLVDYAHTPDALVKALSTVRELTHGKLICVFGCGGDRDSKKRAPMGEAAAKGADFSIITNDNPRTEDPNHIAAQVEEGMKAGNGAYLIELDRATAIELAVGRAANDDAVLIAGKGHENYQIVGAEKRHFDDRETAIAVLAKFAKPKSPRSPS